MSNITNFMSLLSEVQKTEDELLIFMVADVSEICIRLVNKEAEKHHFIHFMRRQLDTPDFQAQLAEQMDVIDISQKALVSAIAAVNRFLVKRGDPILCNENKADAATFAIQLVDCYYAERKK